MQERLIVKGWEQELHGPYGDWPVPRPSGELGNIRESLSVVVNYMDKCSASYCFLVMTKGIMLNFPFIKGLAYSFLIS